MEEIKGKVATAVSYAKQIDEKAKAQIARMCDYDFTVGSKIRIMPDVHPGKGGTIGISVSDAKWIAQLSTRAIGHPLPVTACAWGGLSGAVTKCWKEEGSHLGGNRAKT